MPIGINWLHHITRHLPTPIVIELQANEESSGGFYSPPRDEEYEYQGVVVPASRSGVIVAYHFAHADWDTAAVLAHEWRRHWQYWHGINFVLSPLREGKESYEKHIVEYFSRSRTEEDALRFECAVAPCPENLWRLAAMEQWRKSGEVLVW